MKETAITEIDRPKGYPPTSFASVVCWNCQKGDKQLLRIIDDFGFKTPDYICVGCKEIGHYTPPMQNVSLLHFPKKLRKTVAIGGDIISGGPGK